MAGKETVLRIPGVDIEAFKDIFAGYVHTHREGSEGIISDFNGNVDPEGNIYVTKKNKDSSSRLQYEAKLTGKIRPSEDGKDTVINYSLYASGALTVCLIFLGILSAAFVTFALYQYFVLELTNLVLPATFFAGAYVILLVVALFRPECRSIEKVFDKVVGEYAAKLDDKGNDDDKI